jgi:hypothetical protein
MAERTLRWEGEKTACDCGGESGVAEGAAGSASITNHPLVHISATINQFLSLVKARILTRRACVAPFPPRAERKTSQRRG